MESAEHSEQAPCAAQLESIGFAVEQRQAGDGDIGSCPDVFPSLDNDGLAPDLDGFAKTAGDAAPHCEERTVYQTENAMIVAW